MSKLEVFLIARISAGLKEELTDLAKERKVSFSKLVRMMLEDHLNEGKAVKATKG